MLCGANNMPPDPRILKWCHFPTYILVGQRLGAFRYSLIVQEIGLGLARSKEQARISQCGFCMEKVRYYEKKNNIFSA